MKRILYYTARDMTSPSEGINKKINEQIETLGRLGFQVDAVYRKNDEQLYYTEGRKETLIADKMKRPYKIEASKYLRKYLVDKRYDGAYIRYVYGDWEFHKLLKVLKKKGTRIVIEVPTYPYDAELTDNLENRIVLILDRLYRNKMHSYADRIVTFSQDDVIFGIPTIRTMNGVNFSKIRKIQPDNTYANKVNIIAVANLAIWHGFDRLLEGMGEYYHNGGERDILFHLVGDGQELGNYKQIVDKWKIQDHVVFYGRKDGEELDQIYDYCDLSAACFGFHRIGATLSSNLKSREYMAKGLPILSSVDIDVFQNIDTPYLFKVPYDDTPIDIKAVLEYYDKLYLSKSRADVIDSVRTFAQKICDINVVMSPVVNFFEK